jgi:hypothetical protein
MNTIFEFLINPLEGRKNICMKKKAPKWRLCKNNHLNLSSLYNTYTLSCFSYAFKFHGSRGKCKQGVIAADTDIDTGVKLRSPLTHEDIPGENYLTTKPFHSEALGITFAAVPRTATAFFMSHTISPV